MGLAAEVQKVFRVEWVNPENPSLGFKYLYVTEADYRKLKATDSVSCEPVEHPAHGRYSKKLVKDKSYAIFHLQHKFYDDYYDYGSKCLLQIEIIKIL